MKSTQLIKVAVAALFSSIAATSFAASPQNANLGVSASVANNCTISTTPVAFGAYDPIVANASTALTATGTVVITCTKGATSVTIGLGNGANFASSTRNLKSGSDLLPYSLFQPDSATPAATCTAYATAWDTTSTLAIASSSFDGSAKTFNVCGRIAGGIAAAVGATYADTVVASVNF